MNTETTAQHTPKRHKWAVKIEQRGLIQPVHPPQPSINTMIPLPQPLSFKSSTSTYVDDHEELKAAEAAKTANPPVKSDWTHWVQSYRHTRRSILLVRTLLNEHFGLPTETISIVLDYAGYWVSTTIEIAANPNPFWGRNDLITMPPLGTDVIDPASGSKQPQVSVRGLNPCREIRVRMQVKPIQRKKEEVWSNHFIPTDWQSKPPGNRPFIMGVVWKGDNEAEDAPERRNRNQVFDVSHLSSVLRAEGHDWERPLNIRGKYRDMGPPDPYTWSIPVVEEALEKDKEEEKEVIWRWTDKSAGGDLVRALRAGDSPQLRANHHVFGWGTVINRMKVEVLYTI